MALFTPRLWQGAPFRHPEATLDFAGWHDRWHAVLSRKFTTVPDVRFDQLPQMGDIHQRVHMLMARGLRSGGIDFEDPSDFSLYDLTQRQGWVLFMQIHSLEHERLREATGT